MAGILAYDIGGSGIRVAVVGRGRDIRRVARVTVEIAEGPERRYEVDAERWWTGFVEACGALAAAGVDLAGIDAIAGCGLTRTQVFVDRGGVPVRPAIAFQDARGDGALRRRLEAAGVGPANRVPGLGPFHPAARLAWVLEEEPETWARTAAVLEPKDFINARLTGRFCSDGISQHPLRQFLDAIAGSSAAQAAFGDAAEVVPAALGPFDEVGRVRSDLPPPLRPLAGKPVFCGAHDTWGCVLGSGGLQPGAAYGVSGTSDVFGMIARTPAQAPGLVSVGWGPGLWQLGGPSQGAATRLRWAAGVLAPGTAPDRALADALGAGRAPGRWPPVFLPFLEGERTPYWNPDLRGAFLGLSGAHGPLDMLLAVAEGIGFLSREILRRAEAAIGQPARHVCLSGGLSADPAFRQLRADILGRQVFVPRVGDAGLVGAAAVALSSLDGIEAVTGEILSDGTWTVPDPRRRDELDERFEIFREAADLAAGVSARLARRRTGPDAR